MEKYSYTAFAYVYDELMDNVPYDEWAAYLIGLLKENDVADGLVCELGCGTGQMTRRLAAAGYDMIGIDLSEDMLDVAREQEYGAYEGECDFLEEEFDEGALNEEVDFFSPWFMADRKRFAMKRIIGAIREKSRLSSEISEEYIIKWTVGVMS